MAWERTYTDEELAAAVEVARTWRGVLCGLGFVATSAKAIRSVGSHAERIGADYSHFRVQRSWTDEQLWQAIEEADGWSNVVARLNLEGSSAVVTLKGHAVGVAWFAMCGHEVSWRIEPARCDLLVWVASQAHRVRVKLMVARAGSGGARVSFNLGRQQRPYDPDEIDDFFIIDGELNFYLVLAAVVSGRHMMHLAAHELFLVPKSFTVATKRVLRRDTSAPNSQSGCCSASNYKWRRLRRIVANVCAIDSNFEVRDSAP